MGYTGNIPEMTFTGGQGKGLGGSNGAGNSEAGLYADIKNIFDRIKAEPEPGCLVVCDDDGNVPGVADISSPGGFYRGLKILVTSYSALRVTADCVSLFGSSNKSLSKTNVSVNVSTVTLGANGLDTGSVAANKFYAVYLIYNPDTSTLAGLLSLSATTPQLPSGYTYYTRFGWVRTNTNSYLYQTVQWGNEAHYIVDGTILTGSIQIASGVVGSFTTPTWVAYAINNYIPSTSRSIVLFLMNFGTSGSRSMVAPNNLYGKHSSTTNPPPLSHCGGTEDSPNSRFASLQLESEYIYITQESKAATYVYGWVDNL